MASVRSVKARVVKQKSRSVAECVDPRVERTRARIATAFVALVKRRPYERLRVSDVLPMLIELPEDPCLLDCTRLFAHVQHAHDVYRSLMAGPSRLITERIIQDALEERITFILVAKSLVATTARDATSPHASSAFVSRFVASTMLALIAWAVERKDPPAPPDMQAAYRTLVGTALRAVSPS